MKHLGLFPENLGCVSDKFNIDDSLYWRSFPDLWMQKSDVVAMYWRVKKWRFTHDISSVYVTFNFQREISIGQYKTLSIIGGESEQSSGTPLTNESQLICPEPGRLFGLRASKFHPMGFTNAGIEWSTSQNVPPAFYRPTNEFLPTISYGVSITVQGPLITMPFRLVSIYASNVPTINPPGDGPFGSFSYEFLGKTFTSDIYSFNGGDGPPLDTNGLNVVSSLVAIEYWPYDPQDGLGPIYDTTTGAQIRAFPD